MAPRKQAKTKKKSAVAASKVKTPTPAAKKKKTTTLLSPLEKLDTNISDIAIMQERRDNANRISKESHDYDLKTRIPKIMKEFPGYNICIWGGSPQLTADAQSSIPNLVVTLVPNEKLPPPFVAYSVKDVETIDDLSKHHLSWHNVAPRVYILKSTKRLTRTSIQALSDDSLAMEEHVQLWTIYPSKKLRLNKFDKIDVRFVKFAITNKKGEPIYGDFEKGGGSSSKDYVEMFVEEYGDEMVGDDDEDKQEKVLDVIKKAFEDARDELEFQAEMLSNKGYDKETLDSIQNIKVFPVGTDDALKATSSSSYINKYYDKAHKVL